MIVEWRNANGDIKKAGLVTGNFKDHRGLNRYTCCSWINWSSGPSRQAGMNYCILTKAKELEEW